MREKSVDVESCIFIFVFKLTKPLTRNVSLKLRTIAEVSYLTLSTFNQDLREFKFPLHDVSHYEPLDPWSFVPKTGAKHLHNNLINVN